MSRGAETFTEQLATMRQLYQEYQKHEDTETALHVNALLTDMQGICSQRELGVQQVILELTRQVESAAVLSVYPEAEDTHRRTVAAIQRSINSIQADMAHLEGLSR
ncbi:MAG: hypothetical protein WDW38_006708 [Sanguina aurantia]